MKRLHSTVALTLTACVLNSPAATAEQVISNGQQYALVHLQGAIEVDGQLNEAQWQNATKIELKYENNPGEGIPAPVKTIAYLYEDGHSLHVAFKAQDPNPQQIRGFLRDRDTLWDDDYVGIAVDTFNDLRSGFEFYTNPMGAQADLRMTDNGNWQGDPSWDAIWASAAKVVEDGYVVEMSIPFSALRFPEGSEEQTWNIALSRNYPRSVKHDIANYQSDRNKDCHICQFDRLTGFKNIESGNNFQLTPTLTATRSDSRDVYSDGDWQNGDVDQEVGLDMRWGITQDMVLNATLNPDFSQVEADAAQLDINNTFSLYYGEKRPFFLDGANYFDTTRQNLLHTRTIADPDFGAKLTGKNGDHSYGVMVANDNQTTFITPGRFGSSLVALDLQSDVAVARYKMDIGERNNLGVFFSNRRSDGYDNTVASVDGTYYVTEQDRITYQATTSESENPLQAQQDHGLKADQRGNAYSVGYNRNTRDYGLYASYAEVSEDFRADLGFITQADYKKLVIGGDQKWYGEKGDSLTQYGYFGDWDKTYAQDGTMLEEEVEIHVNLQGQNQFYTNFGLVHRDRLFHDTYYDETFAMAYARFSPASGVKISGFTRFGDQIDFANRRMGKGFNLEGSITWQLGKHLEVDLFHNYNQLTIGGDKLFSANQSDIRLSYQFDIQSYLRLVFQYTDIKRDQDLYINRTVNSRTKDFGTQLLYSYKLNPQTLMYLGYSDNGFQDDNLNGLERAQRTLFAKFSYAWQM